jgi:hypothetical protein
LSVLKATNGDEAIRLAMEYVGKIDLMISDVKMRRNIGSRLRENPEEATTRHARDVYVRLPWWRPIGAESRLVVHPETVPAQEAGRDGNACPPYA